MSPVDELISVIDKMPTYDREKFDECANVIIAIHERYGLIATLAMSIHVAIYKELVNKSQASGVGYFEYLAGKG